MLAYCVAANSNNSQTTPGITMHELLCNWPTVRRKWIKFTRFKQAFLLRHIMPICVASTSVSVILQTPWNTTWGLLRSWQDVPVLFQNPAWQAQTDTAVFLWASRAKYQFRLHTHPKISLESNSVQSLQKFFRWDYTPRSPMCTNMQKDHIHMSKIL